MIGSAMVRRGVALLNASNFKLIGGLIPEMNEEPVQERIDKDLRKVLDPSNKRPLASVAQQPTQPTMQNVQRPIDNTHRQAPPVIAPDTSFNDMDQDMDDCKDFDFTLLDNLDVEIKPEATKARLTMPSSYVSKPVVQEIIQIDSQVSEMDIVQETQEIPSTQDRVCKSPLNKKRKVNLPQEISDEQQGHLVRKTQVNLESYVIQKPTATQICNLVDLK
jgi:hypothetical protein